MLFHTCTSTGDVIHSGSGSSTALSHSTLYYAYFFCSRIRILLNAGIYKVSIVGNNYTSNGSLKKC